MIFFGDPVSRKIISGLGESVSARKRGRNPKSSSMFTFEASTWRKEDSSVLDALKLENVNLEPCENPNSSSEMGKTANHYVLVVGDWIVSAYLVWFYH